MTVTSNMYLPALEEIINNGIAWETNTYYVMLLDSTYTPDIDNHEFQSDLTGEITGDGYTEGGEELTNCSIIVNSMANQIELNADSVNWLFIDADTEIRYAVIYDTEGGTPETNRVIGYFDLGEDVEGPNNELKLVWGYNGLFRFSIV